MANYIASDTDLTAVANAIRTKGGTSAELEFPNGFVSAVQAITTGDAIDQSDIPAYVKAEALDVAARVKAHLKSDSIVFIAGSDSHQSTTAHVEDGNLHGGMAMKALSYLLPLAFAAYLGDYTAGSSTTTLAEGRAHFAEINADIDEAFRGLPQFRTTGNHDPLGYSYAANGNQSLGLAEMYQYIGKYNAESGDTMGSTVSGYCYRDFPAKSLRVICLNTAEADDSGRNPPHGTAEWMTTAQKCWFADTLISTPQDYGIIILAHHPLDWGRILIQASHILRAYVEELAPAQQNPIDFGSGVTYDFTGKNKSAWVLMFHGHVHSFTVDDLHCVSDITGSTTATAYDVKRIACPNMCYGRNNEYGHNTGAEYYDIEFGTASTYDKTADSGKDTAWNVFVVNPSEEKVYAINYGAGIDREVYWGEIVVPVTGVTLNTNSGTLNPGGTTTLTATVAPANATNKSVVWSSSNSGVATVNNGVVTAVAVGSATITVTTQDGGFTASYALTVEKAKEGNLINKIGYTDGKRLSTSDGGYRDQTGGVVIEYIDLSEYRQPDNTVTIRIRGGDFKQISNPYNSNAYVFYKADQSFMVAKYLTEGSDAHGGITVTRTFAGTDITISITGLTAALTTANYNYIRICGLGSGANLDLRINEDFD